MCWTGSVVSHTLLLLVTMATMVSPFFYVDRSPSADPTRRDDNLLQSWRLSGDGPYHYRQATLMMAASSPSIGLRSSLTGSGDTCHVDPVRLIIRPPRKYAHLCAPTTEISYGCRGGCTSYSRVDTRNATNVFRSCSCCSTTDFGFRMVKMKCDGFDFRAALTFPLGCHCRPCRASVQSADIHTLRGLMQKQPKKP